MSKTTIPELVADRVKEHGTRLLFQRRDGWSWKQITWLDFDREVKNIASFLMDIGFKSGDIAIIASSNNLDAIATEIAIYHLGGVVVPLAQEAAVDQITETANKINAKIIFLEQESILNEILDREDALQNVERIVFFSDIRIKHEKIINFKLVQKSGLMKRKQLHDDLLQVSQDVSPDNLAVIFIDPDNAVEVTQGSFMDILSRASNKYSQIGVEDQSFSYMTTASPFSTFINYLTFYMGTRAAVAESRNDFYQDILEVMPTILFETKEGLEDIYERTISNLNGVSREKKIRKDLGERIKYIFTDRLPNKEVQNLLLSSGVSFLEVPELSSLTD